MDPHGRSQNHHPASSPARLSAPELAILPRNVAGQEIHLSRSCETACLAKRSRPPHIPSCEGGAGSPHRTSPQPEDPESPGLTGLTGSALRQPAASRRSRQERRFSHDPRHLTGDRNWYFSDSRPHSRLRFRRGALHHRLIERDSVKRVSEQNRPQSASPQPAR